MSLDLPLDSLRLRLASEIKEDEFIGLVEDVQVKKDAYGRRLVQLVVYSEKYGEVVIALSPSYTNLLVDNLKKLGYKRLGDIVGKEFVFKRVKLNKAKSHYTDPYPRFIPVDHPK